MQYLIKKIVYGEGIKPTKCTLTDPTGVETDNVALWAKTWSVVATRSLQEGSYIEGEIKIVPKEFNGTIYENKTLWPPFQNKKSYAPPRVTQAEVTESVAHAQDRKKLDIGESQERKEYGVKISSTARDATLLLTSFFTSDFDDSPTKELDMRKKWTELRKWLWDNYGNVLDDQPPF